MIKIRKIPKELLDIHEEWLGIFLEKRINELKGKGKIEINKKEIKIDKNFLYEINSWLKFDISISMELTKYIKSFKEKFCDIDNFLVQKEIKKQFKNKREEAEIIRDEYKKLGDNKLKNEKEKELKDNLKKILSDYRIKHKDNLIELKKNQKEDLIKFVEEINIGKKISNFNEKKLEEKFDAFFGKTKELEEKFEIIKYIFSYDSFSKLEQFKGNNGKIKKWGRHEFLTKLGVKVCPYCNRQYITDYTEKVKNKTTADLDHFYIKSLYPYLALSIYNFIPSCQICNRTFKGATNFFDGEKHNHIYPYEEEFGENGKFTLDFANKKYDLNVLLGLSDNLCIDFNINKDSDNKIKNSIETFKLDKIYSTNHKDYVKDLIRKAIIYDENRIDELYNQYGSLFSSKDEVWTMVLGNYINPDDLGKRPLAKLTKDIMDELGIK
jgi:hypothetical protein